MTTNNSITGRDDVLDAFLLEEDHGRATLERYLRNYPEYAAALIDLSREAARAERTDDIPLTPGEQSRIDAAWITHKAAVPATVTDPLTSMAPEKSKAIAQSLGVPRQVVSCFRDRKVDPNSVPHPFLKKFADILEVAIERLDELLALPAPQKLARSFKADGKPGNAEKASFEQILIDAGVAEDERARLLVDEP